MEKILRLQIEEIDRKYNSLLFGVECENPNYVVYLNPRQRSGFGAENRETRDTMKRISPQDSMPLLDSLQVITGHLNRAYRFDSVGS